MPGCKRRRALLSPERESGQGEGGASETQPRPRARPEGPAEGPCPPGDPPGPGRAYIEVLLGPMGRNERRRARCASPAHTSPLSRCHGSWECVSSDSESPVGAVEKAVLAPGASPDLSCHRMSRTGERLRAPAQSPCTRRPSPASHSETATQNTKSYLRKIKMRSEIQ